MKRLVVALLCLILIAAPLAAEAERAGKMFRIGFLGTGPPELGRVMQP
jgi:hypothetical protein